MRRAFIPAVSLLFLAELTAPTAEVEPETGRAGRPRASPRVTPGLGELTVEPQSGGGSPVRR